MSTATLRKTIFAGCRSLGLDEDSRRDVIELATGKRSLSDMSETDMQKVLKALENRGFKRTKGKRRPAAPRGDLRYVHVLWGLLDKAGKLERPGRAGLNAFIRARFEKSWGSVPMDIDSLRDATQITAVIRALEAWCKREGVSLQPPQKP